jgi:hypothetical protein
MKIHFTYTDIQHDPYLSVAYGVKVPPRLFVLDFNTTRAYEWDYERNLTGEFADWIMDGSYKKSKTQFEIPNLASRSEVTFALTLKLWREKYYRYIGVHVNKVLAMLKGVNKLPPISLIYDADGKDLNLRGDER